MTQTLGALDAVRDRFLAAQLAGDRREAVRVIVDDALKAGVPATAILEGVLQSAQREIGRLWQENRISIAEEHMATAIANLALTHLFERSTAEKRNGRRVAVACIEGELHEFPARLVADSLDLAGFTVVYLGANVPTDGLVGLLEKSRPDLLALSVTMSFHANAARTAVKRVRERFGDALPVAIGGSALAWSKGLADELGSAVNATSASELVSGAKKLLGVTA